MSAFRLYTREPVPSAKEARMMQKILSHAVPPLALADLTQKRPRHIISSWRSLTAWYMNRIEEIPQQTLAEWFGMNHQHIHRSIRGIDKIVKAGTNFEMLDAMKRIREGMQ